MESFGEVIHTKCFFLFTVFSRHISIFCLIVGSEYNTNNHAFISVITAVVIIFSLFAVSMRTPARGFDVILGGCSRLVLKYR